MRTIGAADAFALARAKVGMASFVRMIIDSLAHVAGALRSINGFTSFPSTRSTTAHWPFQLAP